MWRCSQKPPVPSWRGSFPHPKLLLPTVLLNQESSWPGRTVAWWGCAEPGGPGAPAHSLGRLSQHHRPWGKTIKHRIVKPHHLPAARGATEPAEGTCGRSPAEARPSRGSDRQIRAGVSIDSSAPVWLAQCKHHLYEDFALTSSCSTKA